MAIWLPGLGTEIGFTTGTAARTCDGPKPVLCPTSAVLVVGAPPGADGAAAGVEGEGLATRVPVLLEGASLVEFPFAGPPPNEVLGLPALDRFGLVGTVRGAPIELFNWLPPLGGLEPRRGLAAGRLATAVEVVWELTLLVLLLLFGPWFCAVECRCGVGLVRPGAGCRVTVEPGPPGVLVEVGCAPVVRGAGDGCLGLLGRVEPVAGRGDTARFAEGLWGVSGAILLLLLVVLAAGPPPTAVVLADLARAALGGAARCTEEVD